ncbi:hypothetical protein LPJ72_005187 [Coemansia sp. Benny D160-2]|nr:hypothetical protein LPJ72_005187 [Coemansia sp. Benny D160-2]
MRVTLLASAAIIAAPLLHAAKPPCDSQIYCYGDLLQTVQLAKVYSDDKTFVSKPTLRPAKQVLEAFERIGGRNATKEDLKKFVDENFGETEAELKAVVDLPELDPNPPFLNNVTDKLLRAYGAVVNGYWKTLVRKQDLSVLCDGCETSMLELKHPFVVPGGRFTEIYYWDTYFVLEGLLRSGLKELSRFSILDLVALVDKYGFVPNGARKYYLDRSQPPFLALMVKLYYDFTGDLGFVQQVFPTLQREHEYWQQEKHVVSVPVAGHGSQAGAVQLNRYNVDVDSPRPESYSIDYQLAHNVSATNRQRQEAVYADMATGAETGWDFSTRWVRDPRAPPERVLQGIRTRQVVPVELNAILYQAEEALADLSEELLHHGGNKTTTEKYRQLAKTRRESMKAAFFDAQSGLYFDYHLDEGRRSTEFSPASLWPYWSFGKQEERTDGSPGASQKAFARLASVLADNPGGVPATLRASGQQWDWPMAWPPLQYAMMKAAQTADHCALAQDIAQAYVSNVFCAWYNTGGSIPGVLAAVPGQSDSGHMFEKFSSVSVGQSGGGGEYQVQTGFGWTNGVLLWTLDTFGSALKTPVCPGTQLRLL